MRLGIGLRGRCVAVGGVALPAEQPLIPSTAPNESPTPPADAASVAAAHAPPSGPGRGNSRKPNATGQRGARGGQFVACCRRVLCLDGQRHRCNAAIDAGEKAAVASVGRPVTGILPVAITVPALFVSCTPPYRSPRAFGVKVTSTVQVWPAP
jgi:hypothetical protein